MATDTSVILSAQLTCWHHSYAAHKPFRCVWTVVSLICLYGHRVLPLCWGDLHLRDLIAHQHKHRVSRFCSDPDENILQMISLLWTCGPWVMPLEAMCFIFGDIKVLVAVVYCLQPAVTSPGRSHALVARSPYYHPTLQQHNWHLGELLHGNKITPVYLL